VKTWVKLYTESNRDPKIGTLTWEDRGIWAALLALAGELDYRDANDSETGQLDSLENTSWHLRIPPEQLQETVRRLTERNMVNNQDGILYVTHFPSRQRRAPSDAHQAVSERVKRYREQHARLTLPVTAACNEDVTTTQRGVTSTDPDIERDTDPDTESGAASPPPAPEPAANPTSEKPKRTRPERDALAVLYHEIARVWPNQVQEAAIVRTVQDHALFQRCIEQWRMAGYKPTNVAGILDWYRRGGAPTGGARARDAPAIKPPTPDKNYLEGLEGFLVATPEAPHGEILRKVSG